MYQANMQKYLYRLANTYNISIGNVYSSLTVIKLLGGKRGTAYTVRCRCICGKIYDTLPSILVSGKPVSCGCGNKAHERYKLSKLDIYLNRVIGNYINNAEKRNIEYKLANDTA